MQTHVSCLSQFSYNMLHRLIFHAPGFQAAVPETLRYLTSRL